MHMIQLKGKETYMLQRIDDIMLGRAKIDYSRLMMQLDSSTGKYEDAGEQSRGFKGATASLERGTTRWVLKGMGFSA